MILALEMAIDKWISVFCFVSSIMHNPHNATILFLFFVVNCFSAFQPYKFIIFITGNSLWNALKEFELLLRDISSENLFMTIS